MAVTPLMAHFTLRPLHTPLYPSPAPQLPPLPHKETFTHQCHLPLIDQQSPYSYGYGEEKKKMLTQEQSNIQGSGNYSMYNTAYPSSVTGGQLYSNYGEYGAAH